MNISLNSCNSSRSHTMCIISKKKCMCLLSDITAYIFDILERKLIILNI